MNSEVTIRSWAAGAIIALTCGIAGGQHDSKVEEPKVAKEPLIAFSVMESKTADLVKRARRLAIRQCCDFLVSRDKGHPNAEDPGGFRLVSVAQMLAELRPADSQSIDAMCSRMALRPAVIVDPDPWLPLNRFPVAQALAEIGGRETAEGIFRLMRKELDRRELLLCAHILIQIDEPTVTFERMRLAKDRSRLEDPPEVRELFFHNLAQAKQWIEHPKFETDEKFRP